MGRRGEGGRGKEVRGRGGRGEKGREGEGECKYMFGKVRAVKKGEEIGREVQGGGRNISENDGGRQRERGPHLDVLYNDKHHGSMAVPIGDRVQQAQVLHAQSSLKV